ncbi:MAG: ATP-binding cassette domain-containing protein [Rhodothermales bacterium]|nr:ATP-binding cassette domain-containing protein [Rhodothermales bacterium]MBO6778021.1 ATP-binding cassette domain-containing protein [Rhodothermales bacterium]
MSAETNGPVVRMIDVHKAFGENVVLRGVTMDVPHGQTVAVMGGSGTGKSVLIKHIVQLLKPDRGEIWVRDKRMDLLDGEELDEVRLSIGYLFQGGALFDSMSVAENFDFVLDRHTSMTPAERADRIEELLTWVGLVDKMYAWPADLSGGQKKRIALARAIALNPDIMLFDEPTTGLDPISVRMVSDLIVRLREELDMTSIAITHDLLCAEIAADYVNFLHEGSILEHGTLDEVRRSDKPELRTFFG